MPIVVDRSVSDSAFGFDLQAIHLPDVDLPAVVAPEDVAVTVTVEIAGNVPRGDVNLHRDVVRVARVHRCAIQERDDLVMAVEPGVDLPLRGADLGEGSSPRRGAEADEAEAVARQRSVAAEVEDLVPIGLARREHERVVAAVAGKLVEPAPAVEYVVAGVTDQCIAEPVASQPLPGRQAGMAVLDVGREGVVVCKDYRRVRTIVRVLDDDITRAVDRVNVVADASHHDVVPGPTIQAVVPSCAAQRIVAREALNKIISSPPDDLIGHSLA